MSFFALAALNLTEQSGDIGHAIVYPGEKHLAKAGVVINTNKAEIRAVNALVIAAETVIVANEDYLAVAVSVLAAPKVERIVFIEGLRRHIE